MAQTVSTTQAQSRPNETSRVLALLVYLIPIIGWLLVFLLYRRDKFVLYHARQAFILTVVVIMIPLGWVVLSWLSLLIRFAGPIFAASAFSLVIAAAIAWAIAWITGMVNALRARQVPVPFYGTWIEES